jgi:Na+/pantothenate symporter
MELRYSGLPAAGLRAFKAVYQVAFVHCIAMGWIFVGMQKLLGVVLGLSSDPVFHIAGLDITPSWLALAVCAGLMFVYCEVAGLWGVVYADLLQFPVAMAGAIMLAIFVVAHFGGLHALMEHVAAVDPGKLSGWPAGAETLTGSPAHWSPQVWDFVVMLGLLWCANKNADGGGVVIQRILAGKDVRHSMLGTLVYAIVNFALRPWAWILVALATLVLVPSVVVRSPVAGKVEVEPPGVASPPTAARRWWWSAGDRWDWKARPSPARAEVKAGGVSPPRTTSWPTRSSCGASCRPGCSG